MSLRPLRSLLGRLLLPLVAMVAILAPPRLAHAWIEVTLLSDDVRVELRRDGTASVDHTMNLRVRGSSLRTMSLPGVDADATPEGDATISPLPTRDGEPPESALPVTLTLAPDGSLRMDFGDGKGVPCGAYVLHVRYRTDLVKSGALERDGTMVRLRWLGPKWPNGLDTAKATFVLPPAPAEPKAASDRRDGDLDPTGDRGLSGAGAFLTTLRRLGDHDELELVRPHVARGEQVAWTLRIDPKALTGVADPKVLPPPAVTVKSIVDESPREREVFLAIALGMAVLFTALTAIKGRQVELHAAAAGATARPIVALSVNVRALLVGPLVAVGVALELFVDPPVWGALVLAGSMSLMAYRAAVARPVSRAPGRWLPISDRDAFREPPRPADAWLDASTRSGKIGLFFAVLVVSGVTWATWRLSPYHAVLAALDGLVLASLFATGRLRDLPPSLATGPTKLLRTIAKRLRKIDPSLRVVAWARFPQGSSEHDEVRLLVMPKTPARGLVSIEIGVAFAAGAGGAIACPEVLVRVAEDTVAEQKARAFAPVGRWVSGRRAGERVLTLEPALPTWRTTAELVRTVAKLLAEAPKSDAAQRGATKSASARGKGDSAWNAGTTPSPLHVTEAAWSA